MKNYKQEKTTRRSNHNPMPPRTSHAATAAFPAMNLVGRNVGAIMTAPRRCRHGDTDSGEDKQDCCNINIYINSNVEGVNNSILVGSEVNLRDPGVFLSFGDVMLGQGFFNPNPNKNFKESSVKIGFFGLILVLLLSLFMFISLA